MRGRPGRFAGALVAMSVLVVACSQESTRLGDVAGRSETTVSAGQDVSIDDSAATADVAAQALVALPLAEQAAALSASERAFQMELATFSGLDTAMGGADALAAALDTTATDRAAAISTALPDGALGAGLTARSSTRPDAVEPLVGGVTGMKLVADKVGEVQPGKVAEFGVEGITASITDGTMTTDIDLTHSAHGLDTKLTSKSDLTVCPDRDGQLTGALHMESQVSKDGLGQTITVDITYSATVDDNGTVKADQGDVRVQSAGYGGGKGEFVDVHGGLSDGHLTNLEVTRTGGGATAASVVAADATGVNIGLVAWVTMDAAARKAVSGGRCVELVVSASPGPKGLDPSETSTIIAQPTSRVDGLAAGGTVTAVLSSGGASVDPSATPVKADTDAQFTYTAPSEQDKTGTVTLEARSKRGIASATIDFDTTQQGYTASGGGGGVTITGTIASVTAGFRTVGSFPGGTSWYEHSPSSATSGSIEIGGGGSGATLTGSGSYTIADNGDGTLTLTDTVTGCVDVSGICNTVVHTILLTPIP